MKAIIRTSLPAAIAASLVAGAVAIPALAATDDDPTTEATEETTSSDDHAGRSLGGRLAHRLGHGLADGEFAERLAAELDLETATVQDAIDAVKSDLAAERLAAAVEAGRLTQEQADRIAAAVDAGDEEALREVRDEIRLERLAARLAEQVEAGELTQEEADEILARAEEGDFPGRRGHGRRGLVGFHRLPADAADVEVDTTSA